MYKSRKTKHSKTPIAIDFDGVIHAYSRGHHDGTIYDPPIKDAKKTIQSLRKKYFIYIYSARSRTRQGKVAVTKYLDKYRIPYSKVVGYKPPAKFYIDDRAIRFKNWKQTVHDLASFEKEIAMKAKTS